MASRVPDGHTPSMSAETKRRTITLPTKICEQIIDHIGQRIPLADNNLWRHPDASQTLRACALTCRAWKYRAQLHLFCALRIDCSCETADGIEASISFLQQNNSLREHLEVLIATGSGQNEPSKLHLIPLQLPASVRIDGVQELRIGRGRLYLPSVSRPAWRQFTSVTHLTLSLVVLDSLADLRCIIASFTALKALVLRNLRWFNRDLHILRPVPISPFYPPCKVRVQVLTIEAHPTWLEDRRSLYFVRWLGQSGITSLLRKLYIENVVNLFESSAVWTTVIEAVKSTLEALYMGTNARNLGDLRKCLILSTPEYIMTCLLAHAVLRRRSSYDNLRILVLQLEYCSRAITKAAEDVQFLRMCPALYECNWSLVRYPFSGSSEATSSDWKQLDDMFQLPRRFESTSRDLTFRIGLWQSSVPLDHTVAGWRKYHHSLLYPGDQCRDELQKMLPATYKKGSPAVWYVHAEEPTITFPNAQLWKRLNPTRQQVCE